jgi:hypothetical protein
MILFNIRLTLTIASCQFNHFDNKDMDYGNGIWNRTNEHGHDAARSASDGWRDGRGGRDGRDRNKRHGGRRGGQDERLR